MIALPRTTTPGKRGDRRVEIAPNLEGRCPRNAYQELAAQLMRRSDAMSQVHEVGVGADTERTATQADINGREF